MLRSLHTRLWLSFVLLIGIVECILVAAVLIYFIRNPGFLRQTYVHIEVVANLIQRSQKTLGFLTTEQISQTAQRLDENFKVRLLVYSDTGGLLVDSRSKSEPSIEFNKRISDIPIIRLADRNFIRDSNKTIWLYTIRILDNGYFLVVANPRPRLTIIQLMRDEVFTPLISAGVISLVISLVLAVGISRWVSNPLQKITSAAQNVSSGNYKKIFIEGPEEVEQLADAFNEMTARVEISQRSQRDFIANVSHDLKTPLTSIQGYAQAILDETANTPEQKKQAAQVIYDESERMNRMVLELLELARLDSGIKQFSKEPIDCTSLLNEAINRVSLQAQQAHVELSVEIPQLPNINGDYDHLIRVFCNLLDNAIKFSPIGGQVSLQAQQQSGHIQIMISDTGIGIPAEARSRIFDRFYQADKSRDGTNRRGVGLGLSIAREIILAHKGSIEVYNNADLVSSTIESYPSPGTTFLVRLPLSHPDDSTLVSRKKRA